MHKNIIRGLSLLLSMLILCGCVNSKKTPLTPSYGIADQSNLYGMCYLMEERSLESLDIDTEVNLMKNLGVKTVRQWMHFSHFLEDPTTVKKGETLDAMHELLAKCSEAGMINIGMNHHNFCTFAAKVSPTCKPFSRDISEGSDYVRWLDEYYDSWITLVTEFPEVIYWEVDNEVNNSDFMTSGLGVYTLKEMAEIATDMFYYASRAIHTANSNAIVVMGSLTEPSGLGSGNTATFLQTLYNNIKSGEYGYFYGKESQDMASKNPDDYFEVACWHPYMSRFNKKTFIEINNSYYQIILDNEGKHKKVFFTEFGWNDSSSSEATVIEYLKGFYEALKEMPYVETANYFKLYDNGTLNNWDGPGYLYYGLFHDADPKHQYTPYSSEMTLNVSDGYCVTGMPKEKAYAYQQIAGGSGDLELFKKNNDD